MNCLQQRVCCYAGRRINPQHLFSNQQRLCADRLLIINLGIFINKNSIGLRGWADEFQIPAQQQALNVVGNFIGTCVLIQATDRHTSIIALPHVFDTPKQGRRKLHIERVGNKTNIYEL